MIYRRPFFIGTVIFFLSAVYYLSFCRYGINLWDEGGIYYGGVRYLNGQSVMTDFFGYTQGRYLLVELIYRFVGSDMVDVRRSLAVLTAFFPLLAFQISRRLMPAPFAVAATLLILSAPAVYYQRFYGFVFLFNIWAVLAFLESRRNIGLVLAGAFIAYLFRTETLIFFLPVYAYLVWRDYGGRWKLPAITLFAAVGLGLFLFGKHGDQLIFHMRNDLFLWGNSFPPIFEGYQGREFDFFAFLENILFYLPFISAPIVFAVAFKMDEGVKRTGLMILSYLQFCAMALVTTRAGFDNLVRCLPLFFIVAPFLAYRVLEKIEKTHLKALAETVFLAVFVLYLADFNMVKGFYVGSVGAVKQTTARMNDGKAKAIHLTELDARIVSELTSRLENETKEGETIFVAPLGPIFYYLAGIDNPTYYDWILPGTLKDSTQEKELVKQLSEALPRIVVLVDIEIDNKKERSLKHYAPLLINWVTKNYSYSDNIAYYQIWKLK